jgi:hypothetical protein
LPKPSYTIDTLTHLSEKYRDNEFVLIVGTDNLESFRQWKDYERILDQYSLYVYPRHNFKSGEFGSNPKVKITDAPMIEISSTFIRNAIRDKKDVRSMLPDAVWKYIEEMHFYEKKISLSLNLRPATAEDSDYKTLNCSMTSKKNNSAFNFSSFSASIKIHWRSRMIR